MSLHVYKVKNKKGSDGDSRVTPREIWGPCKIAVGLKEGWDLDPASNSFSTIPALETMDGSEPSKDGLFLPWFGNVWLNPPFSSMKQWCDKIDQEIAEGGMESLVLLAPGDSTTAWWKYVASSCDVWTAWHKRQHCPTPDNPKGSPGGPLHLFYWNFNAKHNADRFGVFGVSRWIRVMSKVGCLSFQQPYFQDT